MGPVMRKLSDLAMAPYQRIEQGYLRVLPGALRRPMLVLTLAASAFGLSLLAVPLLGTDLIPQLAQDRFEMTVKLPPGTPLRSTDKVVQELQQAHAKDAGIRALYGVSGSGTRLDASPTESGENIGKLSVVMAESGDQKREAELVEGLRESASRYTGAQVDFSRPELFSFSMPLEIELSGQDLQSIEIAGRRMAQLLRENPHYADVRSTVEQGFPEIQIRFDQERAGALGLTGGEEGARRRGDSLQFPQPQDRCTGARAGKRSRHGRRYPQADRESWQCQPGDAGFGRGSGFDHRPQ
jgi:hydrophobic/amphiphilic exporter-1 (mainly G- bacteria), HAE1 family